MLWACRRERPTLSLHYKLIMKHHLQDWLRIQYFETGSLSLRKERKMIKTQNIQIKNFRKKDFFIIYRELLKNMKEKWTTQKVLVDSCYFDNCFLFVKKSTFDFLKGRFLYYISYKSLSDLFTVSVSYLHISALLTLILLY